MDNGHGGKWNKYWMDFKDREMSDLLATGSRDQRSGAQRTDGDTWSPRVIAAVAGRPVIRNTQHAERSLFFSFGPMRGNMGYNRYKAIPVVCSASHIFPLPLSPCGGRDIRSGYHWKHPGVEPFWFCCV